MEIDERSVDQAFEQVQDGRHKRGVRSRVEEIWLLILLGKLVAMRTEASIAQWVRHRAVQLKQVLSWKRAGFACASTSSNVLRGLDSQHLTQVLADLLTPAEASQRCEEEPRRLVGDEQGQKHEHLALDGKTVPGTLGHSAPDEGKMHQLGLYQSHSGVLRKRTGDQGKGK